MPRPVLLALAAGPGFPGGDPEQRYQITLAFDGADRPDPAAWAADPEPWRASRMRPGEPPMQGDVQFDGDNGWSIRFFSGAADSPDAPESGFDFGADPVRLGSYATITEADGARRVYRVVQIG